MAAAAVWAPLVTAVTVASVVAVSAAAAVWNRRRLRVRLVAETPITAVPAQRTPLAALEAVPLVERWGGAAERGRERVLS